MKLAPEFQTPKAFLFIMSMCIIYHVYVYYLSCLCVLFIPQSHNTDLDMQIRVDIEGAAANAHLKLVEYMHGDTAGECIDMGRKYDAVHQ